MLKKLHFFSVSLCCLSQWYPLLHPLQSGFVLWPEPEEQRYLHTHESPAWMRTALLGAVCGLVRCYRKFLLKNLVERARYLLDTSLLP